MPREMARKRGRVAAPVSSSIDMSLFRHSAAVCCSADDVISTCCRVCSKCHTRTLQRERGLGGGATCKGVEKGKGPPIRAEATR